MSKFIIIESKNYEGSIANILFNPSNSEEVINLGDVTLPFTFEPSLLIPPREIYGVYTINVLEPNCTFFVRVPQQTPTYTIQFQDYNKFLFMDYVVYQWEGI